MPEGGAFLLVFRFPGEAPSAAAAQMRLCSALNPKPFSGFRVYGYVVLSYSLNPDRV